MKILKEESKRAECYKLHKRMCESGKVKCPELLAKEGTWETRRVTYNTLSRGEGGYGGWGVSLTQLLLSY